MMLRRLSCAVVAALGSVHLPAALHACSVCFRAEEGPTVTGVRTAVLVLVGVTIGVLSGCAAFVVRFARRAASLPSSHTPAP